MKLIETLKLVFQYKTFVQDQEDPVYQTALDGVSLAVSAGDFVGILGRNGSGKSTLARQITALLTPTEGTVFIKQMDSSEEKNHIPIRKTAGMVFQNPDNQIVGNVVEEDVAFGPENLGVPTEQIWEKIAAALDAVGMGAYREMSPGNLSGGQKQKVAIAGILAMEPECIVFDEPTAMLDPRGRAEVREAVLRLNHEKGITVLYITHHIDEVEEADYIYVMDHGKIALEGTFAAVQKHPDILKDCGIALPFERELIRLLKEGGMDIPDEVETEEELEDFLLGA